MLFFVVEIDWRPAPSFLCYACPITFELLYPQKILLRDKALSLYSHRRFQSSLYVGARCAIAQGLAAKKCLFKFNNNYLNIHLHNIYLCTLRLAIHFISLTIFTTYGVYGVY